VSYNVIEPPKEDVMDDVNENNVQERLEPAVKAVVPPKGKRSKSNKSIFGFFKNLIAPIDEVEDLVESNEEVNQDVSSDSTDTEERPRRNNRGRNRRSNFRKRGGRHHHRDENARNDETVESVKLETPSQNEVTSEPEKPVEPQKKPTRRRAAKMPKPDLDKAGIELVETKKTKPEKVLEKTEGKPKARKKAQWQKKSEAVKEEKIELVETKSKKTAKPRKPRTKKTGTEG